MGVGAANGTPIASWEHASGKLTTPSSGHWLAHVEGSGRALEMTAPHCAVQGRDGGQQFVCRVAWSRVCCRRGV